MYIVSLQHQQVFVPCIVYKLESYVVEGLIVYKVPNKHCTPSMYILGKYLEIITIVLATIHWEFMFNFAYYNYNHKTKLF